MQFFSLRWNNHPVNLVTVFTGLYQAKSLVDVSLAAEGKHLQAHKVVLSACSDYFQTLFAANPCQHPIVILKDISFEDLETVVKFMYHGIVNVSSDKLPAVLKTADTLQIKGLEKNNELMAPYLSSTNPRLLSVPQENRQPSTESLPEFLQRSRSDAGCFPHHTLSSESRNLSFDCPLEVSKKRSLSPDGSSPSSAVRKKFRRKSGENNTSASMEHSSGNSFEESRPESPSVKKEGRSGSNLTVPSPVPSRAGSVSSLTVEPGQSEHIAKKKRAMFQARKGGSGGSGSNKNSCSSEFYNSNESKPEKEKDEKKESSSSQSHSSDREESQSNSLENTLQVPSMSQSRSMVRAASASDISAHEGALSTKFKRGRFLKRQQCQETADDVVDYPAQPCNLSVPSSSGNRLVKQGSQPILPSERTISFSNSSSPHPSPPPPDEPYTPPQINKTPDRQPSLDPLCGLESVPLLYSSTPHMSNRHSLSTLMRPTLPSVRLIPESPEPVHEVLVPGINSPSPTQLYPAVAAYEQVTPPYQQQERKPFARSRSTESYVLHSSSNNNQGQLNPTTKVTEPPQSNPTMEQFGHCPKARDGPALSCNFCWNTTDGSGRILRRKTKYHCPECQTNLCIVPCFQQYHEANEGENSSVIQGH